jgi:hypothetical protein
LKNSEKQLTRQAALLQCGFIIVRHLGGVPGMKKFVAFLIALPVVVLAGGNAHAATFTNTKIAVTGNGPYTVQFTGSCSLAAGETFGGISGVMTLGTTNYTGGVTLPNGPPTPGGGAVPWTCTFTNLPAGAYGYVLKMTYNTNQVIKLSGSFNVP